MEFETSHLYLKAVVGWILTALVSPSQASVSACKAADTAVSGTKAGDLIFGCMVEASFYQFSNTPPQSFLGRSTDEYSTSSFSHY